MQFCYVNQNVLLQTGACISSEGFLVILKYQFTLLFTNFPQFTSNYQRFLNLPQFPYIYIKLSQDYFNLLAIPSTLYTRFSFYFPLSSCSSLYSPLFLRISMYYPVFHCILLYLLYGTTQVNCPLGCPTMHQSSLLGPIIRMSVFIEKKVNAKKIKSFKAIFLGGHHFCVYKGISQKYRGKYATRPFLLSFETGWSN